MNVSSVDLLKGVVQMADGEIVPITKYFGRAEDAPDEGADVEGFDWVRTVVAGPTADGDWVTAQVTECDRD